MSKKKKKLEEKKNIKKIKSCKKKLPRASSKRIPLSFSLSTHPYTLPLYKKTPKILLNKAPYG